VTIAGSVRERDGRISVAVERAAEYHLPGSAEEEAALRESEASAMHAGSDAGKVSAVAVASETPAENGALPPVVPQASPRGDALTDRGRPAAHAGAESNGASAPTGGVVVRVTETGEELADRYRLEDLVKTLLEFRGHESVTLEVETDGQIVRLEMPFVTVHSCPELTERLSEVLGAGGVRSAR
jgi:hypothetical protein